MENSWAKIFVEDIFPSINEEPFRALYSGSAFRPNTSVNIRIGALSIKVLFGISDDEVIHSFLKKKLSAFMGNGGILRFLFKARKSYLNLVKEYRGISYDAMNAHVAIVFSRYMVLSVAQRENEDGRTICNLCFCLLDEMEDITFSRSMCIIIDALADAVMEYFHITKTQLEEFKSSFVHHLPQYMQEALERMKSAA